MPVFAVIYTYTDDAARRDAYRPAHREFIGTLAEQGVNLCSGPFAAGEAPGGLLLIRAADKDAALAVLDKDPFRVQGVVSDVLIREWTPVLGPLAAALA